MAVFRFLEGWYNPLRRQPVCEGARPGLPNVRLSPSVGTRSVSTR